MNWKKNKRNLAKKSMLGKRRPMQDNVKIDASLQMVIAFYELTGRWHGLIRCRRELFSPNGHLTQRLNETLEVLMSRLKKLKSNF
jgi:hypothetical protein